MQQMKLRWMKRAVKHLDTIYDFLAKKNEQAAIKVYNEFLDTADTLLTFPLAGKEEDVLKENPKNYRSLVACKHYRKEYYKDRCCLGLPTKSKETKKNYLKTLIYNFFRPVRLVQRC